GFPENRAVDGFIGRILVIEIPRWLQLAGFVVPERHVRSSVFLLEDDVPGMPVPSPNKRTELYLLPIFPHRREIGRLTAGSPEVRLRLGVGHARVDALVVNDPFAVADIALVDSVFAPHSEFLAQLRCEESSLAIRVPTEIQVRQARDVEAGNNAVRSVAEFGGTIEAPNPEPLARRKQDARSAVMSADAGPLISCLAEHFEIV